MQVTEIDITEHAAHNKTWLEWDIKLLTALTHHLQLYEADNPILRTFPSPLEEEGFKIKRYDVSSID